jgi:hypothetical protein
MHCRTWLTKRSHIASTHVSGQIKNEINKIAK